MKKEITRLICAAICCTPIIGFAQTSDKFTSTDNLYKEGKELFQEKNYAAALPEEEQREGRMVTAVLRGIFAGESLEVQQEVTASYIGMEYRERSGKMGEILQYTRQELVQRFRNRERYSEATDLLEGFAQLGAFEIQVILRNLDIATLTAALAGASGAVVEAFFSNLADRVMYLISEELAHWQGTEEEILAAQRRVLEVGSFCLNREEES